MNVPKSGSKWFWITNPIYGFYLIYCWYLKSCTQNRVSGIFTHCKEVKQLERWTRFSCKPGGWRLFLGRFWSGFYKINLHVRKFLHGEFRINGMRDGFSFFWYRVEVGLCRFNGVGPFVHETFYNNLLSYPFRRRPTQPVNIKAQVRNPILLKGLWSSRSAALYWRSWKWRMRNLSKNSTVQIKPVFP